MNLETYRYTMVPIIRKWRIDRPDEHFVDACSNLALITSCPLIVVAKFIIEIEGSTPEKESFLVRLEEFYA